MKKSRRLLSLILCVSLLLCAFSVPVHASVVGGTLTMSSLGGAMGTGAGSIVAAALPIVPYVLAGGIVVYSVVSFADDIQMIFNSLSDWAKAELESIMNSGSDSFTMSEGLTSELNQAINNRYFDADGEFITGEVIGNWFTVLPSWDYDAHKVLGNTLTTGLHTTSLSTNFINIPDTPFQVRVVPNIWDYWGKERFSLEFYNFATGISYTFGNSDLAHFGRPYDCCSYSIARPCITEGKKVYLSMLRTCSNVLENGSCDDHEYAYQSTDIHITDSSASFILNGTRNSKIDGHLFYRVSQNADVRFWDYFYDTPLENGADCVTVPLHPFESACVGEVVNRSYNDAFGFPTVGTTLYLPTTEALSDANTLTRDGAISGEWTTTLEGNPPSDSPGSDSGFWASLWEWLASILDAIKSIPSALWSAINSLINSISTSVESALTSAFVPSEGFFDTYFSDLLSLFEGRLGILTYPTSVLVKFFTSFLDIGETEPILRWNAWSYDGIDVIPEGEYNLNDVLDYHPVFKTIHDIYLIIVDASLVIALLRMLHRKYNIIISN